jgi:hypothetical protein
LPGGKNRGMGPKFPLFSSKIRLIEIFKKGAVFFIFLVINKLIHYGFSFFQKGSFLFHVE